MNHQRHHEVPHNTFGYLISFCILAMGLGILFVIVSTEKYGVGLSPDSVNFLSVARSLLQHDGFLNYADTPMVVWPPLYPSVLAMLGFITHLNLELAARCFNAFLFGLIVISSGIVLYRCLDRRWAPAMAGVLAVLFSKQLISVSVMAWTEPLFILLTLLFLHVLACSLERQSKSSLPVLCLLASLTCLTKYTGLAVLPTGACLIMLHWDKGLKRRFLAASSFVAFSVSPLALWLVRNKCISGTWFGPRSPSNCTLVESLDITLKILASWAFPFMDVGYLPLILVAVLAIATSLALGWSRTKRCGPPLYRHIIPYALFLMIYASLVIYTSATIAYDSINTRLLSPIFVPLLVILLGCLSAIIYPVCRRSDRIHHGIAAAAVCLWFTVPQMAGGCDFMSSKIRNGAGGYNTVVYRESRLIEYLKSQDLKKKRIYSNAPDAMLALLGAESTFGPSKTLSKQGMRKFLSHTPCLYVWFNGIRRNYLLPPQALRKVSDVQVLFDSKEGMVYELR